MRIEIITTQKPRREIEQLENKSKQKITDTRAAFREQKIDWLRENYENENEKYTI